MKKSILIIPIIIFAFSCKKDCPKEDKEIPVKLPFTCEIPDGFSIIAKDSVVVCTDDIWFYDYARHKIFLKKISPFIRDIVAGDSFYVCADKEYIYCGVVTKLNKESLTIPSIINDFPDHYGNCYNEDTTVRIYFHDFTVDTIDGTIVEKDPRWDERVRICLKQFQKMYLLEIDDKDIEIEQLVGKWKNSDNETFEFERGNLQLRYVYFQSKIRKYDWYRYSLKSDSIFLHSQIYESSDFGIYKGYFYVMKNNSFEISNFKDKNIDVYFKLSE